MKEKKGLEAPVHTDFRGEIRRYNIKGAKFSIIFTKPGMLRSGDSHPVPQYDLILKGEFEITLRKNGKDIVIKKGPNELIVIPPHIPHLFRSLTDTVMIEWWEGPFEAEYYRPYRRLVEDQFRKHKTR